MKMILLKSIIFMLIAFPLGAYAEKFSSFKGSKFYIAEGRWFSGKDKFFFRINEGNANEETITLESNPQKLEKDQKYKICLKIKEDCQLNCNAESIREIKSLKPWEPIKHMTTKADGSYYEVTENNCKEGI